MRFFKIFLLLTLATTPVFAQSLLRVPQDDSFQGAVNRIANGGVIEVSAGTYAAPGGAFRMRFLGKAFTVRGVGGEVVLDGSGTTDILRIADSSPAREIVLENLTFRNGLSVNETFSGGVTVENARVVFRACRFESNIAEPTNTGGGALRISGGAEVELVGSELIGNSSPNRGGAVSVIFASLEVSSSIFSGNSTRTLPNTGDAVGGGIYILDSDVSVNGSRFESNEANWLGGAIYAFGTWRDPQDGQEATRIEVRDSTFEGNIADALSCCPVLGDVSFGGAIHVEDQVELSISSSRFLDNFSERGGAISSYRSAVSVEESRFLRNKAMRGDLGDNGGAIFSCSVDVADASTDFGAINRRPAELTIRNSYFRGPDDDLPSQGACVFADGDVGRVEEGVGTVQENRSPVLIEESVFEACKGVAGFDGPSFGGAITAVLADLTMTGTLISQSSALGAGGVGGALGSRDSSRLVLNGNSFIGNQAETAGGGLFISGAEIEIVDSLFLGNEISPGFAEGIAQSTGAALFVGPAQNTVEGTNVSGVIRESTFVDNIGIAILDNDRTASPFSLVKFNDNTFHEDTFGSDVYKNSALGFGGFTPAELNGLVVDHSNGPDFDKSDGGNATVTSAPRFGDLIPAPAEIATGAPGDPEGGWPAILGYAWSGNSATLAGLNLSDRSGSEEFAAPREVALRVNGVEEDRVLVEEQPCTEGPLLCLRQDRFLIEVDWRDFNGNQGQAQVVPFGTSDSGLFYFFDADNWELLVKVLDGCTFNNHFWVFAAATTNVEYTLTVTDTATGLSTSYFNPLGVSAAAVTDTQALAACTVNAPSPLTPSAPKELMPRRPTPLLESDWLPVSAPALKDDLPSKANDCVDSPTVLCVQQERFTVEVAWEDFEGNTGPGRVVTEAVSNDSGIFYFFAEENWEMLVKVLNGCSFNDHYWVFAAATTNVKYTLTVTDASNGESVTYTNPLGVSSAAVTDAMALATCP